MAWDPNEKGNYAWLSKEARSNGGVQQFIDTIERNGREQGEVLGFKKAAKILIPLGIFIGATGKGWYDRYKQKAEYRKEMQKEAEKVKDIMINAAKLNENQISENDSSNISDD